MKRLVLALVVAAGSANAQIDHTFDAASCWTWYGGLGAVGAYSKCLMVAAPPPPPPPAPQIVTVPGPVQVIEVPAPPVKCGPPPKKPPPKKPRPKYVCPVPMVPKL